MNIRKIESRDNSRLKLARKVRDGLEKEFIFVEGVRLAEEAVRAGVPVEFCLVDDKSVADGRIKHLLQTIEGETSDVLEVDGKYFQSLADTKSSQGIILVCARPPAGRGSFERSTSKGSTAVPLVVMLGEVNNPANLGAVVRTVEAAGAAGVIVSENSADPFSAKALRGSMGSAFRLPIWVNASYKDAFEWARSNGFSTVGSSINASRTYTDLDWKQRRLLILGSEARGIEPEIAAQLTESVTIPMSEKVESLNLAVAAGIIVFEARRQIASAKKG